MTAMLVCAAHSPLMNYLTPDAALSQPILDALHDVSQRVKAFDPEVVVVFGPDHFAGFFYDLMPPFCVGVRAQAMGDFDISTDGQSYNVPENLARSLVSALHSTDVDVAMSYRMQADHGFAQTLEQVAGGVGHYPTIPIFINGAAPPLPPMSRVRRLGEEVGRFLATTDKRVLLIGSGGLSHDPPIPVLQTAPPQVQEVLIAGRNPTPERMQGKVQRNMDTARALDAGTGSAIALNPAWDTHFMDLLLAGDLDAVSRLNMDDARAIAGVGVHEVRTWLAAFAAFAAMGNKGPHHHALRHYTPVPLWNAGFGIVAVTSTDIETCTHAAASTSNTKMEAAWTSA
jgi:2,3-dihydroxyphenylpropionate 1,2-dioxygenase